MSLIKRTLWGVALILIALTLIANAWVSLSSTRQLAHDAATSGVSRDVLSAIDDLQSTITDAETGQRGYLLTQSADYLEPYHDALRGAHDRLSELKALLQDDAQQLRRLAALQPLIEEKFEELRNTVDLQQSGHHEDAVKLVDSGRGLQLMAQIRSEQIGRAHV